MRGIGGEGFAGRQSLIFTSYVQPYLVNFISTCTKLIYEVFGFLECALNFWDVQGSALHSSR